MSKDVTFVTSAFKKEQFLKDPAPQVVFAGRSNVGKSSVINALSGHKGLARVGNTPGKTRCVNYFSVEHGYWVDLPGYGYAKVAQSTQEKWSSLMETFFLDTERIHMGVLIVDLRHDPTDLDIMMSQFFRDANVPWMILANKSDKLKAREIEINVARTAQILAPDGDIPLFPFSAKTSDGKRAVLSHIML